MPTGGLPAPILAARAEPTASASSAAYQAQVQSIPKFVPLDDPAQEVRSVAFGGFAIGFTPEDFAATCRNAGANFYQVPGYLFCSSPVKKMPIPAHVAARVRNGGVYAISIVFHEPVPKKLDQLRTATIEHFTEAYGTPVMRDEESPDIARRCAAGEEVESIHGWVLDPARKAEMSAVFLCQKVDGEPVPQFAITYEHGAKVHTPLTLPTTLASY